jgi:hypothetical protein
MIRSLGRIGPVLLVLMFVTQAPAMGAEPLRVTNPVQATAFDTVPSRQYGTPDLAVDPENP